MNGQWTPEMVKRLETLYGQEGLSATACAARLNTEFGTNLTRNAVIGKASRNLPPANHPRKATMLRPVNAGPSKPKPAPKAPKPVTVKVVEVKPLPELPKANEPLPESRCVKLLGLKSAMCKWPLGDPLTDEFRYCGADTGDLMISYCPTHRRLAYQPSIKAQKFVHPSVHARIAKADH